MVRSEQYAFACGCRGPVYCCAWDLDHDSHWAQGKHQFRPWLASEVCEQHAEDATVCAVFASPDVRKALGWPNPGPNLRYVELV